MLPAIVFDMLHTQLASYIYMVCKVQNLCICMCMNNNYLLSSYSNIVVIPLISKIQAVYDQYSLFTVAIWTIDSALFILYCAVSGLLSMQLCIG